MPTLLGIGVHIWSAILIIGVLVWGYYILTSVRKYSQMMKCGTIVVSTVIVLTVYWYISPIVGVELRGRDMRFSSVFSINLSLLVLGAVLVLFLKYITFDRVGRFRKP